jgi:tetratricopeptide (TPR) repeat protein
MIGNAALQETVVLSRLTRSRNPMSDAERGQTLGRLARNFGTPLMQRATTALLLTVLTAFAQSADWVAKSQDAKQAMTAGRFREAIALYRELVRALPDNPGLAMNLALALHSATEYPEAILQFRSVVKMQPQLAAAWFLLGVDLQKLNRPAEAVQPLKRAVLLEPHNSSARLELADALLKSGSLSEAAVEFRSLTTTNQASSQAWLGLGISYSSLAGQIFEKLEKSFGDSAYLYMLVGQARADQQQYRSAYYCYRRALDLDPSLTDAHRAIVSIYRATGHPDWAAMEEEKNPQRPQADCMGNHLPCLFAQERYDDLLVAAKNQGTAESYYWQVRAYTELAQRSQAKLMELPDSAEIHQLIAVQYDIRGLYLEAVQEWRRALAFQPGNRNFKRKLAQSLSSSGEWSSTVEITSELLKTEPDSADIRFLLGNALLKMQLPEQAVVHLKKAVSLEPNSLPANSALGQAYLRLGRFRDAIPHLQSALPIDLDGSLRYQLAQAYRSAGQLNDAASVLAEYARIRKSNDEKTARLNGENEITPPH